MNEWVWGTGAMILTRENWSTWRRTYLSVTCPLQIAQGLTWDWIWSPAVTGWHLSAWAMAQVITHQTPNNTITIKAYLWLHHYKISLWNCVVQTLFSNCITFALFYKNVFHLYYITTSEHIGLKQPYTIHVVLISIHGLIGGFNHLEFIPRECRNMSVLTSFG
jgi:hypothetical protein